MAADIKLNSRWKSSHFLHKNSMSITRLRKQGSRKINKFMEILYGFTHPKFQRRYRSSPRTTGFLVSPGTTDDRDNPNNTSGVWVFRPSVFIWAECIEDTDESGYITKIKSSRPQYPTGVWVFRLSVSTLAECIEDTDAVVTNKLKHPNNLSSPINLIGVWVFRPSVFIWAERIEDTAGTPGFNSIDAWSFEFLQYPID